MHLQFAQVLSYAFPRRLPAPNGGLQSPLLLVGSWELCAELLFFNPLVRNRPHLIPYLGCQIIEVPNCRKENYGGCLKQVYVKGKG